MNTTVDVRQLADEDYASVVALVQRLVQSPSRGGIDPYLPVLDTMLDWFAAHGLPARVLTAQGEAVGVVCDVVGGNPGPRYVLDACIDTAPFGDPAAWRHPPTSGVVEDVAGVMIGYPGYQQLVVGGRGFLRARLTVQGRAGHTGSAR